MIDGEAIKRDSASALAEIEQIDRSMAELARRKVLLVDFVASCRRLLGEGDGNAHVGLAAIQPHGHAGPPMPPASDRTHRSLAVRRRYWRAVVNEACLILGREGPLKASEIHDLHPGRADFTVEDLYDKLYKRSTQRNFMYLSGGRFHLL